MAQHDNIGSTHVVGELRWPLRWYAADPSSGRDWYDNAERGVVGTERGVRGIAPVDPQTSPC